MENELRAQPPIQGRGSRGCLIDLLLLLGPPCIFMSALPQGLKGNLHYNQPQGRNIKWEGGSPNFISVIPSRLCTDGCSDYEG